MKLHYSCTHACVTTRGSTPTSERPDPPSFILSWNAADLSVRTSSFKATSASRIHTCLGDPYQSAPMHAFFWKTYRTPWFPTSPPGFAPFPSFSFHHLCTSEHHIQLKLYSWCRRDRPRPLVKRHASLGWRWRRWVRTAGEFLRRTKEHFGGENKQNIRDSTTRPVTFGVGIIERQGGAGVAKGGMRP